MRRLSLDQIQAFLDVIELGSFSAAAQRLNLTQPAVSFQIKELERRLGVLLVERVGRRAQPTAAGRELLAHATRVREAVAGLDAAMALSRGEHTGTVRLGTGATACIYLLPDPLRRLKARFPSLDITVRTGNSPEIVSAVERNTIDVGLVTLPAPGRAIRASAVMRDELVALFPPGTRVPKRGVSPGELADRPLVLYESGGNARRVLDEWFMGANLSPKPIMELGSIEAIKEMVAAGLGSAVIPALAVGRGRSRGVVRSLRPRLYRELAVVVRTDKPLHPTLASVIDTLTALRGSRR